MRTLVNPDNVLPDDTAGTDVEVTNWREIEQQAF